MGPIPDRIAEGLRILFIGYNPSLRSGETGHHYANPSNRFWGLLYRAGITERKLRPEEDQTLLEKGMGFTNIVARPTKTAAEITREEYEEGRAILRKKLEKYKPQVACYVGKGVYEAFSGMKKMDWGLQPSSVVEGVKDYVCPSSSGLVRMPIQEVTEIFKGLNENIL
jgi:TDG/mug DNA glycosylase family protein